MWVATISRWQGETFKMRPFTQVSWHSLMWSFLGRFWVKTEQSFFVLLIKSRRVPGDKRRGIKEQDASEVTINRRDIKVECEGNEDKSGTTKAAWQQVVIYCLHADSHVVVSVANWLSIISRWQPHPLASQCMWRLCWHPQGTAKFTRQHCDHETVVFACIFPFSLENRKKKKQFLSDVWGNIGSLRRSK